MIEHLHIRRLRPDSRFRNCDIRHLDFKPGLNLLVGANTSGKSSILNSIKSWSCYESDYRHKQNFHFIENKRLNCLQTYNVEIDGDLSKMIEYKPQQLKENFNFDFFQTDFRTSVLSKFQSSGEGRYCYHDWFAKETATNHSLTKEEKELLKEEDVPFDNNFVVIADEPENSMAINMQFGLFDWFYEWCQKNPTTLQVIIATHSIAAFEMYKKKYQNINYIELTKGWLDKITTRIYEEKI